MTEETKNPEAASASEGAPAPEPVGQAAENAAPQANPLPQSSNPASPADGAVAAAASVADTATETAPAAGTASATETAPAAGTASATGAEGAASAPTEAKAASAEGEGSKEGAKSGGRRRRPKGGGGGANKGPKLHDGTITEISGEKAMVDLGPKVKGWISLAEFEKPPEPGETYQFTLENLDGDRWVLSRKQALVKSMWKDLKPGHVVEAKVIGQNSGGLELKIGPISAFMPASQIDVEPVKDLTPYFQQTLSCEVLEVNRRKRRVVVSRRALRNKELREKREEALKTISEGQVVDGKVVRLEGFGAFVEIAEGLTGLLHVSNISRKRVNDPASVLSIGQEVKVKILELKNGGKRIGLGMKQLEKDPWEGVSQRFPQDAIVKGKVSRLLDFGAFAELEAGIEGLIHISQLGSERVEKVGDVVSVGDELTLRVLSVDQGRQRISLSRLNENGAVIGSDEAMEAEELRDLIAQKSQPQSGMNLGILLREALEKRGQS